MPHSPDITLLYDGLCPVCAREIRLMRWMDRGRGRVGFEDIATPAFDAGRYGLTMADVIGSMHAVRRDGSIAEGMQVFREAYAALGWGWILRPTGWRIVRPLFDALYRTFARIRPRFSRLSSNCDGDRCVKRMTAHRDAALSGAGVSSAA